MAQGSRIEWTDATWNPVAGCTPASAGCLNCYAARMALRLEAMGTEKYKGTARKTATGRPVFTGVINLDEKSLDLPRRWRLPRTIFVNSMSDLFHPNVPFEYIARVFAIMEECDQHIFQVLTKRPERVYEFKDRLPWTKNIWIGTSVEDRRVIDRIRTLQKIREASVRFLSCEPLIGSLGRMPLKDINWVIVGGESGPGARPMESTWVFDIKRQCEARDVPFFFKQWGGVNKKAAGRELDGVTWDEQPVALRA